MRMPVCCHGQVKHELIHERNLWTGLQYVQPRHFVMHLIPWRSMYWSLLKKTPNNIKTEHGIDELRCNLRWIIAD
jgi:hypothetical protein